MIGLLLTVLLAQASRSITVLPPPDPAVARWTSSGPSGGEVYEIAVDQNDPEIAYAAAGSGYTNESYRPGGIFKTTDGGSTWREIGPAETSFFSVAVSRSDPHRLFASSNDGLWRSVDGGAEWEMVLSSESGPAETPAIDPADSLHVWVVVGDGAWRSLDGGSTWTPMFSAEAVGFDSGVPSRLHRARQEEIGIDYFALGFSYSDDRGETWSTPATFSNAYSVGRVVSDPHDPNTLYTAGDFFRSTDRGVSWTLLPGNLRFGGLAVDPLRSDSLYGTRGDGLFVSRDAGTTWTEALTEPVVSVAATALGGATRVFAGGYRGLYSSDDLETWANRNEGLRGARWQSLALDPGDPSTVYAAGAQGLAKSVNAGAIWSESSYSPASGAAVAVDPSNASRILSSGWSAGIVLSNDGGASWKTVFSPGGNASSIVFDHRNPSIVYAAVFYPIKSTDGGETWHGLNHGVESFATSAIAIDSGNSALLYLITVSRSEEANFLFRSVDAGENWAVDSGLRSDDVGILQAILADPGRPGSVWLGTSRGLFRGNASDTTWTPMGFTDSVAAVAADGSADGALYLASSSGGVFRSLDEGATWQPMGTGLPQVLVYQLLVDPVTAVLYAATNDGVYSLDLRRRPHMLPPR